MNFDQREWVNDMVTGAFTGAVGGLVGVLPVPAPPYLAAMAIAGVVGLVTGMLMLPTKWLLNQRPGGPDDPASDPRESGGVSPSKGKDGES